MRRKIGHIAVSAVMLAVVGGLAVAQASTDITAPETIRVISHTVKDVDLNVGDKAWGPGDSFMFSDTLYEETDTTRVGSEHGQCILQPTSGWNLCSVAVIITGRGEIMVQGALHFTPKARSFDMPITGGTGDFANVRGYAHLWGSRSNQIKLNLLP
jgi:Dirigent-like protein.